MLSSSRLHHSIPAAWVVAAAVTVLAGRPAPAFGAGELPSRDFAVRAGTVITMDGDALSPGVVVVREGRFTAVGGTDTPVPDGLPIVEAPDQVLLPGFVEADSQRGLDGTYEATADASFVRVTDGLNPASLAIDDARRNGITTLMVSPGNQAFLAGRTAIVHPQGISVDGMVVKQDAALKISLQPPRSSTRMGHLARLRTILDDTRRFLQERAEAPTRREREAEIPAVREALVALLEGRLPAWVYCPTAADVTTCFALAREYEFHVVPILAPAAWRAADLVATNNVPAILTPELDAWETLPDGTLLHVSLPRVLHDAGVSFALTTDPSALGAQHPWYQAARAVRAGVPRDAALAAITTVPARILGFGRRKGRVVVGADADFILLSADPLSGAAWVDEAYVRGARIYERTSDAKLERLLSRVDEPPMTTPEVDHEEEDDAPLTIPGTEADEAARRWPSSPGREP